jgi:predicted nucleic acid-binding protein
MNGDLLVDTNILIHLLNRNKPIDEFLKGKTLFISFVTEMELLSKPGLSSRSSKTIQNLIKDCILIDFNHEIKTVAIKLRQNYNLKLADSIILSTAIYLAVPVLTFDKTFERVKEVEVLSLPN